MFIEQKKGWSNLLATIPNYGIRDARTKVIEFLLNLDTIENEKLKTEYKIKEMIIKQNWEMVCQEIQSIVENEGCNIYIFDTKPQIINEENLKQMKIYKMLEENVELDRYMKMKQEEINGLSQQSLKVGNNIEELQERLNQIQVKVQIHLLFMSNYSNLIIFSFFSFTFFSFTFFELLFKTIIILSKRSCLSLYKINYFLFQSAF